MASNSAYGAAAEEIAEFFSDYLEGDASRPALALSCKPIEGIARNAIEKSLESFGYPPRSCTYVTLEPHNPDIEGGDISLDAQVLFALIEGLDPLLVIAADAEATDMLAQTYRVEAPTAEASPIRLFGRPAASFQNLAGLLTTERGKQAAWRALKSLR